MVNEHAFTYPILFRNLILFAWDFHGQHAAVFLKFLTFTWDLQLFSYVKTSKSVCNKWKAYGKGVKMNCCTGLVRWDQKTSLPMKNSCLPSQTIMHLWLPSTSCHVFWTGNIIMHIGSVLSPVYTVFKKCAGHMIFTNIS